MKNRQLVFNEVYRVLKPGGYFIFTTYNIDEPDYLDYWNEQRRVWKLGEQDSRLLEFGDVLYKDSRSKDNITGFIHVSDHGEIEKHLSETGFLLEARVNRDKIFDEPEVVKKLGNVIFWIGKKGV